MRFAIVCLLLGPIAARSQEAPSPPTAAQAPAAALSGQSRGTYSNSLLNLTFSYPLELQPEDASAIADRGHAVIYGSKPGGDPEHIQSEACNKALLMVGKASDPAKKQITISGGGKGLSLRVDPAGSVLLDEIDGKCIPPKELKKMDNLLAGIALQVTHVPGMRPIDKPLWYEIQGHKVHFAAVQGVPLAKDKNMPVPDPQIIAGFAVELNGHILFWMLQANDLDFFNSLLDSKVSFGSGAPQPLFPEHIH